MTDTAFRSLEDRHARLQDRETPTDRENRLRAQRAQQTQQAATREARFQANTQTAREEDMVRTQQHTKATKLIAKINKSTQKLTNALPEARGGGGEVGKLSKHYNGAMKTMGGFIKKYVNSNPTYNSSWDTLPDRRKRELTYFHQSLSSNAHHRAINQFNTAKKHAEAAALESGRVLSEMTPPNQQNLDRWMGHLDIPIAVSQTIPVASVIGSKTHEGGRKTRRKRKRRRKTRKRKKKTKRKHKKRHHRTKRRK